MHDSSYGRKTTTVEAWVAAFRSALQRHDIDRVLDLFEPDGFWRDLLAFTWNIHTAEGHDAIGSMLSTCLTEIAPSAWKIDQMLESGDSVQQALLSFETRVARCSAVLRLRGGRCWTLLTAASELIGFEENIRARRMNGAPLRYKRGRLNWKADRDHRRAELGITQQPYCVIVGAGQARSRPRRAPQATWRAGRSSSTSANAHQILGASDMRRSRCTRLCGTTTCPISRSPRLGHTSRQKIRLPPGLTPMRLSWTSISGPARSVSARDMMRPQPSGSYRSSAKAARLNFGRSNSYSPAAFGTHHIPLRSGARIALKAGSFTSQICTASRIATGCGAS